MKKKMLISTTVAVLSLSAFAGSLYAGTYSGGTGEPNDPYTIASIVDWQELMTTPSDWNKSLFLTTDIDLAGVNLLPVGNKDTKFNGVFDGNYHIIYNATIEQTYGDNIGIFGYIGTGEIINLIAENVNITARRWVGGMVGYNESGSISSCYSSGVVTGNEKSNFNGNYVGGLVGYNGSSIGSCGSIASVSGVDWYVGGLVGYNTGSITDCYSEGNVTGAHPRVGGLVGENAGSITSCYSTCPVISDTYVGGLVGENIPGSSIISCYSTGTVNGHNYVGGLVGFNTGLIASCYSSSLVRGTDWYVGGLVGGTYGLITLSHSTGNVNGKDGAGGFVGFTDYHSSIASCYSTGNVSGKGYFVGGFVGYHKGGSTSSCYSMGSASGWNSVGGFVGNIEHGTIADCYSIGNVSSRYSIGGFAGKNNSGSIISSFWDMQSNGITTSAGGTGKTTAEMQTITTFLDTGWDFAGEIINGTDDIWFMPMTDYPRLHWEYNFPIACIADINQPLEAQGPFGAKVTFDGSCSSDADLTPGTNDDINDFNWYEIDPCYPDSDPFIGSGQIFDCNLPLGTHTIILEVTDKMGMSDSNEITITVQDTTAPEFNLSVSPTVLWPANHKMIKITPTCDVNDICDPSPQVSLVDVTANEPCDPDDIQILGDGSIYLCATRSGNSKGRIYTLTYEACDESDNCTTKTATVTVPHDMRK